MAPESPTERKQVPLRGARLRLDGSPALLGSRCSDCGQHFYHSEATSSAVSHTCSVRCHCLAASFSCVG